MLLSSSTLGATPTEAPFSDVDACDGRDLHVATGRRSASLEARRSHAGAVNVARVAGNAINTADYLARSSVAAAAALGDQHRARRVGG